MSKEEENIQVSCFAKRIFTHLLRAKGMMAEGWRGKLLNEIDGERQTLISPREWEKEKLFPTVTVYSIIEMKSIFIVLIGDWGDVCRCCYFQLQVFSVFVSRLCLKRRTMIDCQSNTTKQPSHSLTIYDIIATGGSHQCAR
jgi:hypothetical protein